MDTSATRSHHPSQALQPESLIELVGDMIPVPQTRDNGMISRTWGNWVSVTFIEINDVILGGDGGI